MALDDLHDISSDLRSISLDAAPRLAPYQPLQLDKMFLRAQRWGEAHPSSSSAHFGLPPARPSSPPRKAPVYPLPKPLEGEEVVSPVKALFEWSELVPMVIDQFDSPRDLVMLARVSKELSLLARRRLYERVWIRPWEEGCHIKLVMLFDTLHRRPDLCQLIKHLDVRFFPLATRDTERYELDDQVAKSFSAMTNLEHLVWTRDKSLKPDIVQAIAALPHLRSLEISGHSYRYYDPSLLGGLPALEDLRVMMPDATFRDSLVGIVKSFATRRNGGLRGLGIISRMSPLIEDQMLKDMAPSLRHLRRLTVWGCTRVTRAAIFAILREADQLEELSLDSLPHSGMSDLSQAPSLDSLSYFSLSFPPSHKLTPTSPLITLSDLPSFPPLPSLTSLLLTLSGDRAFLPTGSLDLLASQLPMHQLTRLSLLNLFIGPNNLAAILDMCPNLEELYISVNTRQTVFDCIDALGRTGLKVLHINAPERWGPTPEDLRAMAVVMNSLEEVGSGNRVYEVVRRWYGPSEDGEMRGAGAAGEDELSEEGKRREGGTVVELIRWRKTTSPAYFHIWRG